MVVSCFEEPLRFSCQNTGVRSARLVCKQWRAAASHVIDRLNVHGMAHLQPNTAEASRLFSQFPHLRTVHDLPFKYLPCLPSTAVFSMVRLSLDGTGSTALYSSCLPQLTSLHSLVFLGPVTMTEALLSALGHLPKLRGLTFHKVMFPRSAYQQCLFDDPLFKHLHTLTILHKHPLTSNGVNSGSAGHQFLSTLQNLQHILLHHNSVDQILLKTLDKLALLRFVTASGVPGNWSLRAFSAQQWLDWSKGSGVQLDMH